MSDVMTVERDERFGDARVVEIWWNGERVRAVEGQFVYRLTKPAWEEAAMPSEQILATKGVVGARRSNSRGIGILFAEPDLLERDAGADVIEAPEFEWIEPLMLDYGCAINDPHAVDQWALAEIEAEDAWRLQAKNGRVVLAILDTGVPILSSTLSHEDMKESRINIGPNVLTSGLAIDDHGHGTHVTGIAAASRNNSLGIAGMWDGDLYVVKVLNDQKAGTSDSFNTGVRNAIEFARSLDAKLVINYSAAGADGKSKRDAVDQLEQFGALLVAAAGNQQGGSVQYPAAYAAGRGHVMAIGAVGSDKKRCAFASRGPELTIAAPGSSILSTLPDYSVTMTKAGKSTMYDRTEGTSQASPLVAAVAAMVWEKHPNLTAKEVRERIVQTAMPTTESAADVGAGILNARRALA